MRNLPKAQRTDTVAIAVAVAVAVAVTVAVTSVHLEDTLLVFST